MKNMSKLIIGGITLLTIGSIIAAGNNINDEKQEERGKIDLQLYGSYEVDASGIRRYFSLFEDVPLIGLLQISNEYQLHVEDPEAIGIEWPNNFDFDFEKHQDKYIIITFGRQLAEIQYEYRKGHYYEDIPYVEIVFTEEHHDQTMYVYTMEKRILWPADLPGWGYNSIYVMDGEKRVYIGDTLLSFNKQSVHLVPGN